MVIKWTDPAAKELRREIVKNIVESMKEERLYSRIPLGSTEKPAGAFIPSVGYLTSINDTKLTRELPIEDM